MCACFRGPTAISGGPSLDDVRALTSTNTHRPAMLGDDVDLPVRRTDIACNHFIVLGSQVFCSCVFTPGPYTLIASDRHRRRRPGRGLHATVDDEACQAGPLQAPMLQYSTAPVMVKLILRDKEFDVKPGMTLLAALQKAQILPETVLATREGELILEDEILRDGDVIKLVAVISGG